MYIVFYNFILFDCYEHCRKILAYIIIQLSDADARSECSALDKSKNIFVEEPHTYM